MIEITKYEAAIIRERFPDVFVAKTKHKYYVPELIKVMRILPNNTQAKNIVATHDKNRRSRNNGSYRRGTYSY